MKGALLFLLIGLTASQRDQGVEEYGTVMRTQCADGMLAVTIDYNLDRVHSVITSTSARTLEKANITFGTSCQFENDHAHKYYHLATTFEKCNVTAKRYDHGVRYDGVVFIRTGPPQNQAVSSYHVSCSFLYNSTASTRFEVYNRDDLYDLHTVKSVDTIYSEELKFTIYPVSMTVAKEFPLLFTYPARCFLDNYNGHSNPVTVLENGCPVFDDRKNFYLSAVFQPNGQVWSADTTEVRVVFGNHVLPDGKNSPITALRFSCDVIFCTSEQKHRIAGIPLCPSAAPCNSQPAAQSILSEQEVGGEPKVKLVSAHLPVPINIQLDISGGYGPYKEPIPRSFPVNVTRPPITCVDNGTPVYKFVLGTLVGIVFGFMVGIAFTKMTTRGGYLISESSNGFSACLQNMFKRDTTRCGSAVSQANAAPQPYVKLESSPPVLLSTDPETGSALA